MLLGYNRISYVDLRSGKVEVKDVDEELAYGFIGGRGWAAYILFKEIDNIVDSLHPSNVLVVATGPLTAVPFQSGGKVTFAAISPQTGIYGDSNVGGFFGYKMRKAGIDVLVIKGASPHPVYLLIADGKVEIHDAERLWGLNSQEADAKLVKEYGDSSVASIGTAGEKLVKFACVNVDWSRKGMRHAQAGRTGMGAVMGSKKLKAIVATGNKDIKVADEERLREATRKLQKMVRESPNYEAWRRYGTLATIEWSNKAECLPTYNFQKTVFEYADNIGGNAMERVKVFTRACSNCIIPCEHVVRFKLDEEGEVGVEYETAAMLGSNLGLKSIEEVAKANYLCDYYGLDTISMGSVLAFVMECYQRGLITEKELGLVPNWGDVDAVCKMISMTAKREGFGDLMAEGVKALAERLGKGSEAFAMHVKGLEISAYDHRAATAMALSYATCDIGAHHNRSWAITYDLEVGRDRYIEDKVRKVIYLQHIRPLFDMLGVCRFYWVELGIDPSVYAEAYSAVTGKEFTLDDLLFRSEKVWNLTRAIAIIRKGVSIKDDLLPERDFSDPVPEGRTKGAKLDKDKFIEMLKTYYAIRGWDEFGRPTYEKLMELGLEEVARRLYGRS
ncbi:MAG: aldehyde ferredoxin oxidoreductase family protein [Nitrososphaerota archaeon]|nr:aldehyde ferredoxin oxidoreductase family protein [Aigarchaeota archaeon]MDW8077003.1 aldehyde ferredoxin oxidoreductase family protein [Nitrososphaerota archaeon]